MYLTQIKFYWKDEDEIQHNIEYLCQNWTNRRVSGLSLTQNSTRTPRHKAWNTTAEYPSWEHLPHARKFHFDKFYLIFSKKVYRQKLVYNYK